MKHGPAPPSPPNAGEHIVPRTEPGQQVGQTVHERSGEYDLTWSLDRKDGALTLDVKLVAREELYVADRLWDYEKVVRPPPGTDKMRSPFPRLGMGDAVTWERVPDRMGVYRFVRDGSLRLVFDQAPWPPNMSFSNVYTPFYSRIRAGETHSMKVQLELPVAEYSALARDTSEPAVVEEVSRVLLVLAYRTRASMTEDPRPPPLESAEKSGYTVYGPKLIVSAMRVEPLKVMRRTGYMARHALPGEPGPAPAPVR